MVKYFVKMTILFIIFLVVFITTNSSSIFINNASAYDKKVLDSNTKKNFDKKKYLSKTKENNKLEKGNKETEILKKVDNSDAQYLENEVSSNTQKIEKKIEETYNDKKNQYNSTKNLINKENKGRENKELIIEKVSNISFFKLKKNEKKINKIKTYLSDNNVNKLKNLSFNINEIKAIDEIFEEKFNSLEKILGSNIFYTQNRDFNFSKFKNKDKNIERLSNVNDQLDYITKTLQVMRLK